MGLKLGIYLARVDLIRVDGGDDSEKQTENFVLLRVLSRQSRCLFET